jgi:UDP-glucose 4-epimerase
MNVSVNTPCFYVTGANGFVGSRLCARLSKLGEVCALLRRPADGPWRRADRIDLERDAVPAELLRGVDVVIHLAARTHAVEEGGRDEALYRRVNVDGTRRLLECAALAGVRRFVFMSSVKAQGEGGSEPADETAAPCPSTAYGRTKLEAETMVLRGGHVPEAVVLRPALVYGPGVKGNLERMIAAMRSGLFPPVPDVGNRRSLVHVDDLVNATVLAAERPEAPGRAFIVTDGRPVSTREMYVWIRRALGKEVPRWAVPPASLRLAAKAGDVIGRMRGRRWFFDSDSYQKLFESAVFDSTAIERTLGFAPEWTLESAMPQLVGGRGPEAGAQE